MGAIEDTRKVVQDFLAPELRELKARLEALEKRMDERFAHVDDEFTHLEKRMDERFAHSEQIMDERFEFAERRAEQRHEAVVQTLNHLANYNEMRERLAKLESKGNLHQ
jgi:tetrahydromethanopterin S-methyltransferase subunit G